MISMIQHSSNQYAEKNISALGSLYLMALILFFSSCSQKNESNIYIAYEKSSRSFPLAEGGTVSTLYVSNQDHKGVHRVANHFQNDIEMVTSVRPKLVTDEIPESGTPIIIGTLGKSKLLTQLTESGKLDLSILEDKREKFVIQTIINPFPGVESGLIIAGSDKRGTIYGMFDVSEKIGVSPWYWWADVPVKERENLYVLPGRYSMGEPKVQYRGIFINDEAPALAGWAHENFGSFNHEFYQHVFELILRLKGNFLWPAMWGRSIYDDDSLSPVLADEYGVVIGTSHHEPLMRAHVEWGRYGEGSWNYEENPERLRDFWREGIERMGDNESMVTIGMRGDGDEPMTEGTAITLLEKIVEDQRTIIQEVTGKPASETPQSWALYKEVQDYYDKGMDVPEDVMLLLCDDNWGNIRRLPAPEDKNRAGGFGIYYHFDYVGGPRNYKWLNTNQIERTWEQMHLAYEYGAKKLWLVNVGDIKPMEFPITFFLEYAWNPEAIPAEALPDYYTSWAAKQFGPEYAEEIGGIIKKYTKYNARRKPELLTPETYSLHYYNEAERVMEDYNRLAAKAKEIGSMLPEEYHDAYFQLVLFPVTACANLNELYITAAKNQLYAKQKRVLTNEMAYRVRQLFAKDSAIAAYYHNEVADGKWNHIASQTHIGYTYWQEPPQNNMPEVTEILPPEESKMGVAIEGSDSWWPESSQELELPVFDPINQQEYYIEIFNQGAIPFEFLAEPAVKWIKLNKSKGEVSNQLNVMVSVDWSLAPEGEHRIPVTITGEQGRQAVVYALVNNATELANAKRVKGFVEKDGVISIQAEHYTLAYPGVDNEWLTIPNLGRTGSAMTPLPVTANSHTPGERTPYLSYDIYLFEPGEIKVKAFLSPTLNFTNGQGFRYAVSIDDGKPQIVNMHKGESHRDWQYWVSNNINICSSTHKVESAGQHSIKFWMVDPAVVLQKMVVERKPAKPSYLGPPESKRK